MLNKQIISICIGQDKWSGLELNAKENFEKKQQAEKTNEQNGQSMD